MADYFREAHEAFTTCSLGLARAAYRKLFDTLDLDAEVRNLQRAESGGNDAGYQPPGGHGPIPACPLRDQHAGGTRR